jgi:hypothetical protein
MKLIVIYFFLADFYFWRVVLDLDKYIFPWQACFIWWGWEVVLDYSRLAFGKIWYIELEMPIKQAGFRKGWGQGTELLM